jgi:FlaA1/EpsC-like NDP-sugar epimerase
VIPTFARQIAAGGPLTVTDPRMTRFFMSVEEAVQLVLQASVLSLNGEIFMLEMGEPVRILDLAERMIRLSGHDAGTDIPVRMIGRRPGEKLHEELHSPEEVAFSTSHPFIRRLAPADPPTEVVDKGLLAMRDAMARRDGALVRDILFTLTTTNRRPVEADQIAAANSDPISA